ncbi:MAG: hypothetical protein ACREOU_08425 [Candidatus Eiseniibacteriota bacterium]
MSRRVSIPVAALAAFSASASLLSPTTVQSKVPDPRNSTVEPVLVGNPGGHAMTSVGDPGTNGAPGFLVVLRDINNGNLMNEVIELDFSAANVRLGTTQSPGTTVDCTRRVLSKWTDLQGRAVFTPCFGGATEGPAVLVTGDGVWLAHVPARSTDLDGLDGVTGLSDLGRFSTAFLTEPHSHPEADFDASGSIGLTDFALFAGEFLSAASATYCP